MGISAPAPACFSASGAMSEKLSLYSYPDRPKALDDQNVHKAQQLFRPNDVVSASSLFVWGALKRTLAQPDGLRKPTR
jgi:hypothetical protein